MREDWNESRLLAEKASLVAVETCRNKASCQGHCHDPCLICCETSSRYVDGVKARVNSYVRKGRSSLTFGRAAHRLIRGGKRREYRLGTCRFSLLHSNQTLHTPLMRAQAFTAIVHKAQLSNSAAVQPRLGIVQAVA